jgi:hypothetical protein
MKNFRKTLAQWTSKLSSSGKTATPAAATSTPRPLDQAQLRQVAGGTGETTQSPKGNWS